MLDLKGQKFGRLKVLNFAYSKNKRRFWKCQCEEGNVLTVPTTHLRSGHTQSCGCFQKERNVESKTKHGLKYTKYYRVWEGMMSRCYNKNRKCYKHYGGRGIGVYSEWHNPTQFIDWCKSQGSILKEYSLDRIDNNGNYGPDNCKFSSPKDQVRNRRNITIVEVFGKSISLPEAVEKYGKAKYPTIYNRIHKLKWTAMEAILTPVK